MQIYALVKNDLVNYQRSRRASLIKSDLEDYIAKAGVDLRGEKNIRRACDRIMLKRKKITFVIQSNGSQRIDILNGNALRKYYNEAVKCREDQKGYPHLYQYANHIDGLLISEKTQSQLCLKRRRGRPALPKSGKPRIRKRKRTDYPDSWTGLV